MKLPHIFATTFLAVSAIVANAQEKRIVINHHNNQSHFKIEDIESVTFHEKLSSPAMVTAAVDGESVTVKWIASKGAASYVVERSDDGINFSHAGKTVDNTFVDYTPLTGKNLYRVQAVSDEMENSEYSSNSNIVDFIPEHLSATGLYLGIIGFNHDVQSRNLRILMPSNLNEFTSYVSKLTQAKGTLLYHSVNEAIDMLASATLPEDVTSVSIVTFTDGLDQGSLLKDSSFKTSGEYLDNLQQRIANTKIAGKNISAYSIGLRGSDVKDITSFRQNLISLASSPDNAAEVTNLTDLNKKFQEIATHLSETTETQLIKVRLSGNPGTKFRLTFDYIPQESTASVSELYIEGTYTRKRGDDNEMHYYFSDISYHGLTGSSTDIIEGEITEDGLIFVFDNIAKNDGSKLSLSNYKRWRYVSSLDYWHPEEEGGGLSDITTETTYNSAAIILVLDCSTSLNSQFYTVKNQANDFIRQMASKTVENPEAQWEYVGKGRFNDGALAKFLGYTPELVDVIIQQSSVTPGMYRVLNPWKRLGGDANLILDATKQNMVCINPQSTGIVLNENSGEIFISNQFYVSSVENYLNTTNYDIYYPQNNISLSNGIFDFGETSLVIKFPDADGTEYTKNKWYTVENNGTRLLLPSANEYKTVMRCQGGQVNISFTTGQSYLYEVNWGDRNIEYLSSNNMPWNHTYANDGDYEISITGAPFTSFNSTNSRLTSFSSDCASMITYLNISGNNLSELDLSHFTKLKTLDCSGNNIVTLDVSGASVLTTLDCSRNKLTSLGLASAGLRSLNCSFNSITELTPSDARYLTQLNCSNNLLSSLDCSKCDNLLYLDCSLNRLNSLVFGAIWQYKTYLPIKELNFSYNNIQLVVLTRTSSIEVLNGSHNILNSDTSSYCPELVNVDLSYNQLKNASFGGCQKLETANYSNNQISTNPYMTNPLLTDLDISYNLFDSFNISDLPALSKFNCSYNPGANGIFHVYCDYTSQDIPDGFTTTQWEFNNETVSPLYGQMGNYITATTNGSTIKFTVGENETVEVAWGDGKRLSYTSEVNYQYTTGAPHSFTIFGDITELNCSSNALTELDLSCNSLIKKVDCSNNNLTNLDISKNTNLVSLNAGHNNLSDLEDISLASLTELNISDNSITKIPDSGWTNIKSIDVSNNKLSSLSMSDASELTYLNCDNNSLKSINIENCKALRVFTCEGNPRKDGLFDIYSWFTQCAMDEGDYSGFIRNSWTYEGQSVTPFYGPSVPEIILKIKGGDKIVLGAGNNNNSSGTYTVDWGDGEYNTYTLSTSEGVQHNYASTGDYVVKIKGEMEIFVSVASNIAEADLSGNRKLTSIDLKNNKLSNLNLNYNPNLKILDISNNDFRSLDLTNCPGIWIFYCTGNYSMTVYCSESYTPLNYTQESWVRDNVTCTVTYVN